MKKFRLPRKIKKKLKNNIWLYPPDEKGSRVMAMPAKNQKEYDLLKHGEISSIGFESRKERDEIFKGLYEPINMPDEKLKEEIDRIYRREFRESTFNTLIKAKKDPRAIKYYYGFINSLAKIEKHRNLPFSCVDSARYIMRKKKKKSRRK